MQIANTIRCSQCGTTAAPGKKFCSKCGNSLAGARPAARPAATPAATRKNRQASPAVSRKPAGERRRGLSIWWIVVPTLVFAFLSRNLVQIAIVAGLGAALWIGKSKQIPDTADKNVRALQPYLPFLPALQIVVVFVMLGGSIFAVAMIMAGVIAAVHYREKIIPALEPWWQIQSSIPSAMRKPLAVGVALLIGYYFGKRAGGQEWTYTLISNSFGILAAFLIIFTPPDSMRRARRS